MKHQSAIKHFSELSTKELHALYQLRTAVFVVEQHCPYQEVDDKDVKAWHYLAFEDETCMATARILPPGVSYPEWSIGRVCTAFNHRKTGQGKVLMTSVLDFIQAQDARANIRISAQCYLERFYSDFGFTSTGKTYLEDDIPHVEMYFSIVK